MTNFISTPQIRIGKAGSQYIAADPGDICYSFCTSKPGWLLCDGSSYLQSDYPALFECLGIKFGGDDTHFNVPDLRGRFLQMVSADAVVGDMKDAGLPNITGTAQGSTQQSTTTLAASGCFKQGSVSQQRASAGNSQGFLLNFDASLSSSIYGKSSTVQPPSMLVNYFIKY